MASDLTSGLLTLAGTLVGGLITFGGTYWNTRVQRWQSRQTRRDQLADCQRQVLVIFLTRLDTFRDHTRELVAALEGAAGAMRCEELHKKYLSEWQELVNSNAAVQIGCPGAVAGKAEALKVAAGKYSDAVDVRKRDGEWPRGSDNARKAVAAARLALLETTQKYSESAW